MEHVVQGVQEGSGQWQVLVEDPREEEEAQCEVLQEPSAPDTALEEVGVGVIMDLNTIVLLEPQIASACCSPEEWESFIRQQASMHAEMQAKRGFILTLPQRNSLLSIRAEHLQPRLQLWSIVPVALEPDCLSLSECDKQSMLTILSYELSADDIASLRKNCIKIEGMLMKLRDSEESVDSLRVQKYSGAMMQWIYDAVVRMAVEDKQMGYCKGVEYVCLGVVVAYPCFDLQAYDTILHHLMYTVGLRELYLQGFPYYFQELTSIRDYLQQAQPWLWQQVQATQAEIKNLFITYYRTCLLYRLTHPTHIRKIIELILVYGLPAIKMILLRLIAKQREYLQSEEKLLQVLSSSLVTLYLGETNREDKIGQKFKDLFII